MHNLHYSRKLHRLTPRALEAGPLDTFAISVAPSLTRKINCS